MPVPRLQHRPTITLRDRQFAASAVGTIWVMGTGTSARLRENRRGDLNWRAR
jgi:hypothetical protein